MTLVITLLLLLSLLMMASAITYITISYANLSDAVTHRPLAIDAAETCIDKTIEWFSKKDTYPLGGSDWVQGAGLVTDIAASSSMPLYGYSVINDTIPLGLSETRSGPLKNIAGRSRCNSVTVEKLVTSSVGIGTEIGTSSYDKTKPAVIKIKANGLFDVPLMVDGITINNALWRSSSSQSIIEEVIEYSP